MCLLCVDKCFFRCSVSNAAAAAADQSFFSLFFLHLRSPLLYTSSSRPIHRPVLASPPHTHGSHATLISNLSRRSVAAAPIENRYITRPIDRVFSSVRNYQQIESGCEPETLSKKFQLIFTHMCVRFTKKRIRRKKNNIQ